MPTMSRQPASPPPMMSGTIHRGVPGSGLLRAAKSMPPALPITLTPMEKIITTDSLRPPSHT